MLNACNPANYRHPMTLPYHTKTVRQAEVLLNGSERVAGRAPLDADMQGSATHQTLMAAEDNLFANGAAAST